MPQDIRTCLLCVLYRHHRCASAAADTKLTSFLSFSSSLLEGAILSGWTTFNACCNFAATVSCNSSARTCAARNVKAGIHPKCRDTPIKLDPLFIHPGQMRTDAHNGRCTTQTMMILPLH